MSKRLILSRLKKKGIIPNHLQYERDQVEGGGWWNIELDENVEQVLMDTGFPEKDIESQFENLSDILAFIDSLPIVNQSDVDKYVKEGELN